MTYSESARGFPGPLADKPVLALIIGDFGRDAAIRFCTDLARAERAAIRTLLPEEVLFYDEYRRFLLTLIGDLQFTKREALANYQSSGRWFDEEVLVGFPKGPSPESVTTRLGVLALEGLDGPLRRGVRRACVFLPCNTLAPVSWALEERFSTEKGILELLADAGLEPWRGCHELIETIVDDNLELSFPTVPDAVIAEARRRDIDRVAPLGTTGIVDVYRESLRRGGAPCQCHAPNTAEQQIVRQAIVTAIDGTEKSRARSLAELNELSRDLEKEGCLVVEACTDLDYGVGLDSVEAYVNAAIRNVYGDDIFSGKKSR